MPSSNDSVAQGCGALLGIGLFFSFLLAVLIAWLSGGFHFSSGYRDGHIQKFSQKGWIWTTNEGEMALPGLRTRGSGDDARVSNTWDFTVRDDNIRKQIEALTEDDLVRLHYDQYWGSPPWYGSTQYHVNRVERLKHHSD